MLIYSINLCIAYKKLGEIQKMKDQLNSMDWSNCSDRFIFAKYVLLDEQDQIVKFMRKFTEPEWKLNYQVWPLFDELREKEFFKEEYKAVFDEEFIFSPVNLKVSPKDIKKIEKEIRQKYQKRSE